MSPYVSSLLLVEPDELLSDITAFRLELLGYSVTCVPSAKEALKRVTQAPFPSIIIVDTNLPDINGLEFINQLKTIERTRPIPVMALSLDADSTAEQRARHAGANEFLVLPYDPAVLEQKLGRLLAKVTHREKKLAPTA